CFAEARVPAVLKPFKGHHLAGDEFDPVARQPVEGRIAIALAAGAAGIGHHPHVEFVFEQTQHRLQQAHMGLTTRHHQRVAARGWRAGLLKVLGQAADIARGLHRWSKGIHQL
ncbi:hypothetical protein RZS08_55980, partial [Arthrospira platensis SPKY1]|nr:hypothetical protein [Arthrospira platensis SPKY1]